MTEVQAPLVFWHKEYLSDSGGVGRWRGGLSQRIEIAARDGAAFECSAATFDRRANPARGRLGGAAGAAGRVEIEAADGQCTVHEGKGSLRIPAGGRLRVDLPGGGGFGAPGMRDPALCLQDLSCGLTGPPTNPIPAADESP